MIRKNVGRNGNLSDETENLCDETENLCDETVTRISVRGRHCDETVGSFCDEPQM